MLLYASPLPLFFRVGKSEWIRDSERMERARVTVLQSEERERKEKEEPKTIGWTDGGWMDGRWTDKLTFFPILFLSSCLVYIWTHNIHTFNLYYCHFLFYSPWVDWMCVLEESLTHFTSQVQSSPPSHHQSFFFSFHIFLWRTLICIFMFYFFLFFLSCFFLTLFLFYLFHSLSFSLCVSWVKWEWRWWWWWTFGPLFFWCVCSHFLFSLVLLTTDSYFSHLVFLMCCVILMDGKWVQSTTVQLISILCHS